MTAILKLANDDAEKELSFELEFMKSLTVQQRFELMFAKSKEMAERLLRHGHREPVALVKRS